MNMERNSY